MIEAQVERIKEVIDYFGDSHDSSLLLDMSMKLGIDPETISNVSMAQGHEAIGFILRMLFDEGISEDEDAQRAVLPATIGSIWMSGFFVGYVVGTGRSAKEVMES